MSSCLIPFEFEIEPTIKRKKRDVLMSLIILAQAGQSLRRVQKCVCNDNELQQNNGSHLVHFLNILYI